jgi:hypothetical protein
MVVVIVEDNANWRNELALMYSRILSDSKEVTDYHPSIRTFATAREAIEYFKPKPGERSNASPKADVLSLDLNLGRDGGGTGLDVLKSAVNAGQKFVTIAVSGFATDEDLHEQLGSKASHLIELETRVAAQTKAKCFVHEKKSERLGSVSQQAKALEKRLRAQVHGNSNVLRDWTKALRQTAAELNGKCLCLHFELPKKMMEPSTKVWTPGVLTRATRPHLSKIGAWNSSFEPIDENSTTSDLLTRLLFLISSGKNNYQTGLSLRLKHELIDPDTGQHAAPLPKEEWICPRKGEGKEPLTPRESFQLTQLVFQKQFEQTRESFVPMAQFSKDGELDLGNVAGRSTMPSNELIVSGLLDGQRLSLPDKQQKGLRNGDSLDVERYVDGKELAAVKSTRSLLNTKLKTILGVNYDLIASMDQPFKTYTLQLPGFVYIQRDSKES